MSLRLTFACTEPRCGRRFSVPELLRLRRAHPLAPQHCVCGNARFHVVVEQVSAPA